MKVPAELEPQVWSYEMEVIPKLKEIMPLKNTLLVIFQRLKENTLKEILLITPLKKTLLIIHLRCIAFHILGTSGTKMYHDLHHQYY